MRKIPCEYENPVDNIFIYLCQYDAIYRNLGMTPNNLTSISLIISLLSSYFLFKGNNVLAAILFLVSYYYDCLDGYYAREYNMVTEFGDYYDHISDITKMVVLLSVMFVKNKNKFVPTFGVLLVLYILMSMHLGCQEKMYPKKKKDSLSILEQLCPNPSMIQYTKYFGVGTLHIIIAVIILLY